MLVAEWLVATELDSTGLHNGGDFPLLKASSSSLCWGMGIVRKNAQREIFMHC